VQFVFRSAACQREFLGMDLGAGQQVCEFSFCGPGHHGLRRSPGGTPRVCVGVSWTSGAFPEAPGTNRETNQKADEPNSID
jgi:hypothetical protein